MQKASLYIIFVLGTIVIAPAFAQNFSSQLREGSGCYSCGLKAGGQSIPLLSLPAERRELVLNRSLGGIAGSSFQTEQATPEQTLRQVLKAPPEPVFNTQTNQAQEEAPRIDQLRFSTADRFRLQRSFEQRFNTETEDSGDAFRLPTPDVRSPLNILGGKRKRNSLSDLFAPNLGF